MSRLGHYIVFFSCFLLHRLFLVDLIISIGSCTSWESSCLSSAISRLYFWSYICFYLMYCVLLESKINRFQIMLLGSLARHLCNLMTPLSFKIKLFIEGTIFDANLLLEVRLCT